MKRSSTAKPWPIVWAVLIGMLALLPRVGNLADFFTTDEAYHWIERVAGFSAALRDGVLIKTSQTGHPGVTIMWLGTIGGWAEQFAVARGWAHAPDQLAHLAWLRLPHALLEALLIPWMYLLLRRLVSPLAALLAALLLATSPYLIAHARLLHLDALLASFTTLALLLLLLSLQHAADGNRQPARRTLLGSAICAGLALLTKGPALILLPFAGALLFLPVVQAGIIGRRSAPSWQAFLLRYSMWLAVAALTVIALWPALWVDPRGMIVNYAQEILGNGRSANGDGQFFLGRAIADPGPLFYLVAGAFRTTPAMLLGLLLLPLAVLRAPVHQRSTLLALLAFTVFWTCVMTVGPKKFDRYTLPTWPALLILAAAGLAALPELAAQAPKTPFVLRRLTALIPLVVIALVLANDMLQTALIQPYYLSYYNSLFGGGPTAQRNLLIGWGEGMDQVGGYLNTLDNPGHEPVLSTLGATLRPFSAAPVQPIERFGQGRASYAVVYMESIQRAADPPLYAAIMRTVPLREIVINGIVYAKVYQVPRPFDHPLDVQVGDGLWARGFSLQQSRAQLIVMVAWDVRTQPAANYLLFLHLIDAAGQRVAQVDVAPGGDQATRTWQPGRQIAVPIGLGLPANLPGGRYRLVLGIYDQQTGARLPLGTAKQANATLDGPNTLLLDTITIGE